MLYRNIYGVPDFECTEYAGKTKDYVLLIPIINEGSASRASFRVRRSTAYPPMRI